MSHSAAVPFLTQFAALRDPRQAAPRQAAKELYPLPELLLLYGAVAGTDDFVELTLWGRENLAFLRRFLPFAHAIPSHDTLCEVVAAVDPDLFKTCFTRWVERLRIAGPEVNVCRIAICMVSYDSFQAPHKRVTMGETSCLVLRMVG